MKLLDVTGLQTLINKFKEQIGIQEEKTSDLQNKLYDIFRRDSQGNIKYRELGVEKIEIIDKNGDRILESNGNGNRVFKYGNLKRDGQTAAVFQIDNDITSFTYGVKIRTDKQDSSMQLGKGLVLNHMPLKMSGHEDTYIQMAINRPKAGTVKLYKDTIDSLYTYTNYIKNIDELSTNMLSISARNNGTLASEIRLKKGEQQEQIHIDAFDINKSGLQGGGGVVFVGRESNRVSMGELRVRGCTVFNNNVSFKEGINVNSINIKGNITCKSNYGHFIQLQARYHLSTPNNRKVGGSQVYIDSTSTQNYIKIRAGQRSKIEFYGHDETINTKEDNIYIYGNINFKQPELDNQTINDDTDLKTYFTDTNLLQVLVDYKQQIEELKTQNNELKTSHSELINAYNDLVKELNNLK